MLLSGNKLHSCWYLIAYFSVLQFWAESETFSFSITSDHLEDVLSAGQVAGPLKLSSSQIHAALRTAVPRFLHADTHILTNIPFQSIRRWTELSLTQLSGFWLLGSLKKTRLFPTSTTHDGFQFFLNMTQKTSFMLRVRRELEKTVQRDSM